MSTLKSAIKTATGLWLLSNKFDVKDTDAFLNAMSAFKSVSVHSAYEAPLPGEQGLTVQLNAMDGESVGWPGLEAPHYNPDLSFAEIVQSHLGEGMTCVLHHIYLDDDALFAEVASIVIPSDGEIVIHTRVE